MDVRRLLEHLEDAPVVASVKDAPGLAVAMESRAQVLFLLYGDLMHIGPIVSQVHQAGKVVFVHLDLIDGLSSSPVAVDFILDTGADGILTTKPSLIRRAKALGLLAVQRFFLLDSMALENISRHLKQDAPDLIEVLPGLMPQVIGQLARRAHCPVITGGLITDKDAVIAALSAGAVAVSSTDSQVWSM